MPLLPRSTNSRLGELMMLMNIIDIFESLQYLIVIYSRGYTPGGSKSVSNDYIQIYLEWHLMYLQFQLCRLHPNAYFLQQISRY
jgi:hypothetical protein